MTHDLYGMIPHWTDPYLPRPGEREGDREVCEHEESEWIEQENLWLDCTTCNGSLQIDKWECVSCGEVGTTEREVHNAGCPCNPIKWEVIE